MRRLVTSAAAVAALALALALAAPAGSSTSSPPGTATKIKALVAASSKITRVDAAVAAQLSNSNELITRDAYPSVGLGCTSPCTFGDTTSKRVVVLFGDSHALMWLPALDRAAIARHDRLVLYWAPTCPLVALTGLTLADGGPRPNCPSYFEGVVAAIHKLAPVSVILGERTYQVTDGPGGPAYSQSQWAAALEKTIRLLKTAHTRVGVLEDTVAFTNDPLACLAAYPTDVQECAVANPNLANPGQQAAEREAAKATGATWLATTQWFCTKTCSPVVGDYVVHYDVGHVAAPYDLYLSKVLGTEAAALL